MMRGLTYLGLGAGLMYLFDPNTGRRRRALLRDQGFHLMHEMRDAAGVVSRDLKNRACGLTAEARSMFNEDHAPDEKIAARVRSALGRVVSHPRAIRVEVRDGRVSLSGPVLASEVSRLMATTRCVRGVHGVENHLEVHSQGGDHPALQGGTARTGVRPALLQENWSPTTRLLVGLTGVLVGLKLMNRPGMTGLAIGALGAGLAASSLSGGSSSASSYSPATSWDEPGGMPFYDPARSHDPRREMTWASP